MEEVRLSLAYPEDYVLPWEDLPSFRLVRLGDRNEQMGTRANGDVLQKQMLEMTSNRDAPLRRIGAVRRTGRPSKHRDALLLAGDELQQRGNSRLGLADPPLDGGDDVGDLRDSVPRSHRGLGRNRRSDSRCPCCGTCGWQFSFKDRRN